MSGEKLVFVSVMYSPGARMRWGSVHNVASRQWEETSSSGALRTLAGVGQVRMACWNDSGSDPHWRQVGFGFLSNQKRWAAR